MHASFKIAALFPLPCRWGKKCGNFKTNLIFTETSPLLYCLSSRNFKVWAEGRAKKEYRDVQGEINGDVQGEINGDVQWRFSSQMFKMFITGAIF